MSQKRKRCNYSEEDLLNAISEVKSKNLSYRKAAARYNIPTMTLSDKVKGKTPMHKYTPGPSSYLSQDQEEELINYLLHMAKIGYGVSRKDIPDIVKGILDKAQTTKDYVLPSGNSFVDNKPSRSWIYRFLERHPEVSARTPENLGFQRAYITEESIRNWFGDLKKYLREEYDIDVVDFLREGNSDRIYNLDESGFPLQGTNGKLKIITGRGTKCVYKLAPDTKQQITVLACVSAGGSYAKPLVIFPGLNTPKYNFRDVNEEDYDVGHTPNG